MKIRNYILCAGLVVALYSCNSQNENKVSQLISVNVAQATAMQSAISKKFAFISKPYRATELSFRVGGPIKQFNAFPGTHYRQGEVVAEIDNRDFIIRKERAEGVFMQAKAEYERVKLLFDMNNLSASSYEKAKADYIMAKSAYEMATNELNDTRLIAPFEGYVAETYVEKFQDVKPTQRVVSFTEVDKLKIEVYVTQDVAMKCNGMKEIDVEFDAFPSKKFKATVIDVSKTASNNNLSYLFTASLSNTSQKLLAGMSGKVQFTPDTNSVANNNVAIPNTSICNREEVGSYVWVVDKNTGVVSQRKIEMGAILPNGKTEIKLGLREGEYVATSGLRFLSDKMKVEIISENN